MKRKSRKLSKAKATSKLHIGVVVMVILSVGFSTLFFIGEPYYTSLANKLADEARKQGLDSHPPPATTWNFLVSIPVAAILGGLVALGSSCFEWTNAAQALVLACFNCVYLGLMGLVVSQVVLNYANYTRTKTICSTSTEFEADCALLAKYFHISLTGAAALVFSELFLLIVSWARSSQILRQRHEDLPLNKIVYNAFQTKPGRNVLFLGKSGAGKTHTFYRLKWSEEILNGESKYERKPLPSASLTVEKTEAAVTEGEYETKTKLIQMGFNNEIIKFHHMTDHGRMRRFYECWDVSGSDRFMWRSFYIRILFDIVVYCIDATQYHSNSNKGLDDEDSKEDDEEFGDEDEDSPFVTDRMELLQLLNEPCLQHAQFVVFLNFKKDDDLVSSDRVVAAAIKDFLDLREYEDKSKGSSPPGPGHSGSHPKRRLHWVENYSVLKVKLVQLHNHTKTPTS